MGIFGTSSPFDEVVTKATLETNTKEDWSLILDICDRVTTTTAAPKECLRAIVRRLNHQDPHVVVQAITLLDACVNNCGLPFHLEVASREFEQEFIKLITKIPERQVRDKLLQCLKKWAENEFKSDPQLGLIPSLVSRLRNKGYDFPAESPQKAKKSSHHHRSKESSSSAPAASQEDADLAKAIELSLKEAQGNSQSKSLYPQTSLDPGALGSIATTEEKEPRKVRALYDFEAAEENELTFYSGEIVFVTDDSDKNWWVGSNQRGKGLFPANFVTTDLSAEPETLEPTSKKTVQFAEDVEVQSVDREPEVVEIDESKIDRVLHMLHEADPTGDVADPPELATLEDHVNQMGPLIDQELEKIDRRHAQLTRLGGELVEALNMYHNLMREPIGMPPTSMPYGMKMGMDPSAMPSMAMPQFSQGGGPLQYAGYPPYDPNVPYSVPRPPMSLPATNGTGYGPIHYQMPPNDMQPHSLGNQQIPNSIHNGQAHPQQMPTNQVNMGAQNMGQNIYTMSPMMMPQGQPYSVQSYDSNPTSQPQMGIPPHMGIPNSVNQQQYVPHPQAYPQSPSAAATPNAPTA